MGPNTGGEKGLEVAKRTNYSEDRGLKVRFSLATIVFETGQQMERLEEKWPKNGEKTALRVIFPLFRHFLQYEAVSNFPSFGHIRPIFGFGPISILYQAALFDSIQHIYIYTYIYI